MYLAFKFSRTKCGNYKKDGYRQLNVRQLGSLRPCDHRGKCYKDRKRIHCLSNASQHVPIYLQPFLRYSEISVASDWFLTVFVSELALLPHFAFPSVHPWDNRGKCHTVGKRIQCLLNALRHVPIYLQPFPSNSSRKNPKVAILAHFWHILASTGFAPGTIAVSVTWIEREFNAGQMPRSIYPSIFNRFPIIKAVKSKVRNFSTFFAHFGLPCVRP